MNDNLHQNEEALATPQDGSESEADLEQVLSELFPEDDKEEQEAKFLDQVNKLEGRNYKTIQDYAKTVKERQKAFSEQGRKAKEEKTENTETRLEFSPVIKNLYFKANPEAQSVWDDLVVPEAKRLGKDPFELYEGSKYLQGEAKFRFEEAQEKDKTGKKISKPSSKISGTGGSAELSEADRALLARRPGLMDKYIKQSNK